MYEFSETVPVNPPGARPALSRAQLWRGLVLKAEDPVLFVPGMESSAVLERFDGGLVREATYGGQRLVERVTYDEPREVLFQQVETDAPGFVSNVVSDGDDGLALTFAFGLRFPGVAEGSDDERERGEEARPRLAPAAGHTVAAIREMAETGRL